jgi:ABC-type transport system involved in multi-copper enzyme maturation permease subunit
MVTLPLYRWEVVLSKAIAMVLSAVLILMIVSMAGMIAVSYVSGQVETTLTPGDVILPVFNALPIILFFMMMGLFFSAFMPQRRFAVAATTGIVLASYFGNNLLPMIADMENMTRLLPFYYYQTGSEIFTNGVEISNALVLLTAAAVFLLLAIWSFSQRNITTGIWFWRRGHAA